MKRAETGVRLPVSALTTTTILEEWHVMAEAQSIIEGVVYKGVPDFPAYRVGNVGSVWSCYVKTYGRVIISENWHRLNPSVDRAGYRIVGLNKDGKCHKFYVHHLVLLAFVGPRPEKMVCCHYDGDKLNNHISNLRWGTRSSNKDDERRHGTINAGSRHGLSKLYEDEAREIRDLHSKGWRICRLGRYFGVSEATVRRIVYREGWKHV